MLIFSCVASLLTMISPEQERRDVITKLKRAVELLAGAMDIQLIPASGCNIAFGTQHARDGRDIASVTGGIVVRDGKFFPSGPCAFDTGADISRVVLTIMKFDAEMRSAAVIRYSTEALNQLADMSIACCGVDRSKEPPGISTMDWGIASCCSDGVPDVIYDRESQKSSGVIYLIGEDVVGVANTIIILSHRIQ
jgi:predicted fused transcriptional regulator/phosphomethylpyrimidine kinase